jgi:hypothetical protein
MSLLENSGEWTGVENTTWYLVRRGLRCIIKEYNTFYVVGAASSGNSEGLASARLAELHHAVYPNFPKKLQAIGRYEFTACQRRKILRNKGKPRLYIAFFLP